MAKSSAHFESSLALYETASDHKRQAICLFSLGCAHGYLCNYEKSISEIEKSVALLNGEPAFDAANSHFVLGYFLLELKKFEAAENAFSLSFESAQSIGFKRGFEKARAGVAAAVAERGDLQKENDLVASSLRNLSDGLFVHPAVFHYASVVAKKSGDLPRAIELHQSGLNFCEQCVIEAGIAYRELASIFSTMGLDAKACEFAEKANSIFATCGAQARIVPVPRIFQAAGRAP